MKPVSAPPAFSREACHRGCFSGGCETCWTDGCDHHGPSVLCGGIELGLYCLLPARHEPLLGRGHYLVSAAVFDVFTARFRNTP